MLVTTYRRNIQQSKDTHRHLIFAAATQLDRPPDAPLICLPQLNQHTPSALAVCGLRCCCP